MSRRLIGQGSNKDIWIDSDHENLVFFEFSNRVSVFDWGAIPDLINGRAESLLRFAIAIDRQLKTAGIPTLTDPDASEKMGFLVQTRVQHARNSQSYQSDWSFLPLECVFRWGVTDSSSFLKRRPDLKPGTFLDSCVVEFFTKLEAQDRLLSPDEVKKLIPANLDIHHLENFCLKVAEELKNIFSSRNYILWDGKLEIAFNSVSGELALVDAVTPDELRLESSELPGFALSKELLRYWLGQTLWAQDLREKKRLFPDTFKEKVIWPVPSLGPWRKKILSLIYKNLADSLTGTSTSWSLVLNSLEAPRICIVGEGGREEALRWRAQKEGAQITNDISQADAVFVSTDNDLASGKVNHLLEKSIWAIGPTQQAAEVEWSKIFGRRLAQQIGIRVPEFSENLEQAKKWKQAPVIKQNGLAAGKGVKVPESWKEFEETWAQWKEKDLVFEERCSGIEASAFFHCGVDSKGVFARPLGTAQDFKRRFLGNEGPNTGGMGAYSPHPQVNPEDEMLFQSWAQKTVEELQRLGRNFSGVLYLGLMKDPEKGWVLIEYNSRLGDPETQALVLVWPAADNILRRLCQLDLPSTPVLLGSKGSSSYALALSLVHPDYPEPTDRLIDLPDWKDSQDTLVFKTASKTGRLAYLAASGLDLWEAADKIFESLIHSPWKDCVEWRSDILR